MSYLHHKNDSHLILNEAFLKISIDNQKIELIISRFAKLTSRFRFVRIVFVICGTVTSFLDIFSRRLENSIFIVREFSNLALFVCLPLFFFLRRRIFFNINHNIYFFNKSIPFLLKVLALMGFNFIFFDGHLVLKKIPKKYRSNFFTPLFPMTERFVKKPIRSKLKVGIVSDLRPEKIDIVDLRNFVSMNCESALYELSIGVISSHAEMNFNDLGVKTTLTSSREDYYRFLESIDFIIIFAKASNYYYRHSGTIMDAISFRVIPIVPNYPVFCSQINNPKKIGVDYPDISLINNAIVKAIDTRKILKNNMRKYISVRSGFQNITSSGKMHD